MTLGSTSSGARYDDLKLLQCEIQVRTVMQDAWSVLSHHLIYKREDETPDILKRRINALAGALDAADFAFQAIRDKRDEYIASVATSAEKESLASVALDLDSLTEYLKQKFPDRELVGSRFTVDVGELLSNRSQGGDGIWASRGLRNGRHLWDVVATDQS